MLKIVILYVIAVLQLMGSEEYEKYQIGIRDHLSFFLNYLSPSEEYQRRMEDCPTIIKVSSGGAVVYRFSLFQNFMIIEEDYHGAFYYTDDYKKVMYSQQQHLVVEKLKNQLKKLKNFKTHIRLSGAPWEFDEQNSNTRHIFYPQHLHENHNSPEYMENPNQLDDEAELGENGTKILYDLFMFLEEYLSKKNQRY